MEHNHEHKCVSCGACDRHEICAHCRRCKNCGGVMAGPYQPFPAYPYFYWQWPYVPGTITAIPYTVTSTTGSTSTIASGLAGDGPAGTSTWVINRQSGNSFHTGNNSTGSAGAQSS